MPAAQLLLFPDPRPLVERLGREFFRSAPECPGVYLMRDSGDAVLYVGKARNLRKRLGNYRVANPDRMPRRHLRMLRDVVRIEWLECANEPAAIAKESQLLRSLRPKFNRAGTWPSPPRFIHWRCVAERLEIEVGESPESGWRNVGPLGSAAIMLRTVLVRLLWCALNPQLGLADMPAGWLRGRMRTRAAIRCVDEIEIADRLLLEFFGGEPERFAQWVERRSCANLHPFDLAFRKADLEAVVEFCSRRLPAHVGERPWK